MSLSALELYNTIGETSLNARLEVLSGTLYNLPTAANVFWSISGLDNTTLNPIDTSLSGIRYWFSRRWNEAEYPICPINTVSGTHFYFTLSPTVLSTVNHLGITPVLSGGSTVEFYVSGINDTYNLSGTHLFVSNYGELVGEVDSFRYLNTNPPSGILSGYLVKDTTVSSTDIWGLVDYSNGHVWLDLTHVSAGLFEPNYYMLYGAWEGNYGNNLFSNISLSQSNPVLTATQLKIYSVNDTDSYWISVSSTSYAAPYPVASYNFFPRSLNIQELTYDFTTATLSAVYKERDSYITLSNNDRSENIWPFDSVSGRAMCWKGSGSGLSAFLPLSGNVLVSLNSEISGWSTQLQNIQLTAQDLTTTTYQITARFPDDTFGYRTSAVYTFKHDPILNEDLKITLLSANNIMAGSGEKSMRIASEIMRVYRQVTTNSSVFYVEPTHPLVWCLLTPSLSGEVEVCSGIVPADFNKINYHVCREDITSLSGYTGVLSTIELSSSTGIITGTDVVYGVDYLQFDYKVDSDLIFTWSVSYSGTPYTLGTPYDTHTFQVYSNPTNIFISAVAMEQELFTRSITAKVINDRGDGYDDFLRYKPLHPLNKVIWNMVSPDINAVTARTLAGEIYNYNGYTDDTMVFDIQTSEFDLVNVFPVLCTITLQVSVYDTYNTPTTFQITTSLDVTVDTFPASSLFDSYLKVNYEISDDITDMWRVWAADSLITASDMTTISGTNILSGTRVFTLGDGRSLNVSTSSFTYPTTGVYTINLQRSGVSASGWLSAHRIDSSIDLHLISRFLTADFIAFPTYVFLDNVTQVVNSLNTPITTLGVSSYNVGHTEPFILSAFEGEAGTYLWRVDETNLTQTTSSVTYSYSNITPTTGLPIRLAVYNDEMLVGMPTTYKDDVDGSIQNYPNIKQTDDSSLLFQNLRVVDYPSINVVLDNTTSILLLPFFNTVMASPILNYPNSFPLQNNSTTIYWTLSTPNWTRNSNSTNLSTNLILGSNDTVEGVIKYNATYPLVLNLVVQTSDTISAGYLPSDWGISTKTVSSSQTLSYNTLPELLFVPNKQYYVQNENVNFVNLTQSNAYLSSFYINDGYHTANTLITGTDNFETSYPETGTYSVSISGNTQFGSYSTILTNIVTILTGYDVFDPDVSRIFGATELVLPNTFEKVQIPPNEWVTAENFNRSINRLNDNLSYLENMTRFYNFPPIADTGWMGVTYTGITSSFRWYDPNLTDYIGLSGSVSNSLLNNLKDITQRGSYIYITDNDGVKIFDNKFVPTLLNTITYKTIGDPISNAKSVVVDSSNRIYVLDKNNNRVLVFAAYIDSTNPKSNEFLFEWGGLGSIKSKTMFNNPNQIYVDTNDYIWVVDTGNKALKQYTRTGGWLKTYDLQNEVIGTTIETGGIISMTLDSEQNIHVLTKDAVLKYGSLGTYLTKYTFKNNNNELPQKIISADGYGFLYICLQTAVVKVLENGAYAGYFADNVLDANYSGIWHNVDKNFYIANSKNILRYFEINVINSSTESTVNQYIWSNDEINVKADENVEHWVVNRVLKRFWDNLELFRRSLRGRIEYTTDAYGRPIINIRDFTPIEYLNMALTPKDDIFVGINEYVSSASINRCLKQIFDSMNRLKNFI